MENDPDSERDTSLLDASTALASATSDSALETITSSDCRLFNIIDALAYVADIQTYELYFVSDRMLANLGVREYAGRKCYEVLQGRSEPCPFCTNTLLKPGEIHRWTFENKLLERQNHNILKDTVVLYHGRRARLETAVDISEQEECQRALESSLKSETLMVDALRILRETDDIDQAMERLIAHIGKFFGADRAYTFSFHDGLAYNTHEWCRRGVAPQIERLQGIPSTAAQRWSGEFAKRQIIACPDIEAIREVRPSEYQLMKDQGISCYYAAPIITDQGIVGFCGIDNPSSDYTSEETVPLIESIGRFLSASVEEKRDRRMLEESKHRYDLATKGAGLGIWEYDVQARRITCPNGSLARYGMPNRIENVPDSILDQFIEEDRAKVRDMYERIAAGAHKATGEFWLRRGIGQPMRCERTVYTVERDEYGRPGIAYGLSMDVTLQKQGQDRYRAQLRSIISANRHALCMFQLNLTRDICTSNGGTSEYVQARVHSATAEGLFANIADIVVGKTDRAQVKSLLSREKLLARFEAGESAVDIDYRRQDADLRPIWARTVLTMLRNPDTQDVEGVIYSLDVTAEKRNEEIFNIITSQEYDLIALLHLDTMQFEAVFTGETLPQFYRDFLPAPGYMCDFRRLCRAAHQSVVDEDARTVYADNSKIAYIRNRIIRDGHYEAVVKEKFPDCANGMMYRRFQHYALKDDDRIVLVIESDVTQTYRHQQQEVERERELRVQADAANQAKSDFLSSVSHDMRTPLNAVLGYAGIAKRDADIADVKGYLDKIERAGSVLKQLVEDTLDLNRISTGEVSLKKAPVDANEILQDLLATIKPAMDEKHITLIYDTSACPMAAVNVNADRLREILLNLLNNAMKYTDEGGMVTLRIERLSTEDSVAHDRITVADTGIGMSGEFLPKIFEPFSQERTERNADVGGSGLGLAVTKRLVELMGGTIEVQSQLDKGSTFTIHIDFELVPKKKEKPLSEKEPDAYGLSGRKALLVEDNEMNSEIMKMLLGRAGMDVVCAYNGKEALTMFEASEMGEYNVVLMDLRMPVMDGYEATRCIRALGRPDAENVPIIAVTANAFDEDIRTCLDVGMNAHVSKPVNPTALLATIADYVR